MQDDGKRKKSMLKYLDFETLYCSFGYIFNKVIHYILDNIENTKNIYFLI